MLLISTRLRYSILALLTIASHKEEKALPLKNIARTLGLSLKYLEKIFRLLKKGGLVKSSRGACGGYLLAKSPQAITIYELALILEGKTLSVECLDKDTACQRLGVCPEQLLWKKFQITIDNFLKVQTLNQLLANTNSTNLKLHSKIAQQKKLQLKKAIKGGKNGKALCLS